MKAMRAWPEALEEFRRGAIASGGRGYFSISGNSGAEAFRSFVTEHATGTVVDCGCGAQPKPIYLDHIADYRITGIDPIEAPHPFAFILGTVESVRPSGFGTVICATSLDHMKDAADALQVMRHAGRQLIFWHEGSAPVPADMHTFHVTHDDLIAALGRPTVQRGDFFVFNGGAHA